jgi:hypothetical protein
MCALVRTAMIYIHIREKARSLIGTAIRRRKNIKNSDKYADKIKKHTHRPAANNQTQKKSVTESSSQLFDDKRRASTQKKLQTLLNNSTQMKKLEKLQGVIENYPAQLQQPDEGLKQAPIESGRAQSRWAEVRKKVEESGKFNTDETRANVKKYLKENPEQADMIYSAGGAWLANQMNLKDEKNRANVGPVEAYMGKKEDKSSAHAKHLENFKESGHAFIVHWAHRKILGMDKDWNFDGWGKDANFIGISSAAQALVDEASKPGGYGLYYLEKRLGVADGDWVGKCKPVGYGIWRYHVKNPQALNIRMASGAESQAYSPWYDKEGKYHEGEWVPKGETLGGAKEAVVDSLPRDIFFKAVANGNIQIEFDSSMKDNTAREVEEQKRPWKS